MEVACESLATVQPCASSPGLASRCALKAEFSLAPSHDLHLSRLVSNSCQSVSCAQVNSPKSEKDRGTLDTLPTRHGGPAFPSRGSREPCREPARRARDRRPPGRADAGRGRQAAPASSARPCSRSPHVARHGHRKSELPNPKHLPCDCRHSSDPAFPEGTGGLIHTRILSLAYGHCDLG